VTRGNCFRFYICLHKNTVGTKPTKMFKMRTLVAIQCLLILVGTVSSQLEIPCGEFHPNLDFPCLRGLNEVNATKINCDGAVFPDFPVLPYRFYIQEFSQRQAGLQTLGAQLFTASDIPLKFADFSDNQVRRLTERLFDGVEDTIEVIILGNNLLGDNLNPVFSSGEFQNLKFLRQLDLSYNHFIGIEEGLLDGCVELKVSFRKCYITIQQFEIFETFFKATFTIQQWKRGRKNVIH